MLKMCDLRRGDLFVHAAIRSHLLFISFHFALVVTLSIGHTNAETITSDLHSNADEKLN